SYPSFTDVPRWLRAARVLRSVPGLRRVWPSVTALVADSQPKLSGFLEASTLPGAYFLKRGLFLPRELPAVLGPELAAEALASYAAVADAGRVLDAGTMASRSDRPSAWEAVHVMESGLYMRNQLLRDADWASMAHSLELRVPLVDVWLTEVARAVHFE